MIQKNTDDLFELIDQSGSEFINHIDDQKLGRANNLLSGYIYEKMNKYSITPAKHWKK